jgi:hypothetical protein
MDIHLAFDGDGYVVDSFYHISSNVSIYVYFGYWWVRLD